MIRFTRPRHFMLSALCLVGLSCATHAQTASSVYTGTTRDPFARRPVAAPSTGVTVRRTSSGKTTVKKEVVKPEAPKAVPLPDVQLRIENYRARRSAAIAAQTQAPKPITAFSLSEIEVTGIFRTPRGYAAMVEATPIKLSYVIYPGEMFYDAQLVAVEENRLVFRRETLYANGKRENAVEFKPLRKADAVRDALTAQRKTADVRSTDSTPTSNVNPNTTPDAVTGGTTITAISRQP